MDIYYTDLLSWIYKHEAELIAQQKQRSLSKTYKDGAVQFAIHQKSISKTAKRLGIPYQNLYNWVRKRYGLARDMLEEELLADDHRGNSKYDEKFKAEAVQLAYEKQSVRKAAEKLKVPYSTLNKWYRNIYGLSRKRLKYTEEFKAEAIQLAHQLGSVSKAARQLNVYYGTLNGWYRKIYGSHYKFSGYDEKSRIRAAQLAHQEEKKKAIRELINIFYRALKKQGIETEAEFKAKAVKLAHEKGVREAAEDLDISYWNLNRWYRKTYGLSQKRPRYTKKFKFEAVQLARQMGSIPKAAKKLKMPHGTLYKWSWQIQINGESSQSDLKEIVNF